MKLELEPRLRALAAFARQGNFSAAAAELFISQPAVSKHIAELERQIGVPLVVRRARGSTLTPTGEFLAQYVLRAESLLAQATRGLVTFSDPAQGLLALAASGTPGTYLLPRVIVEFHNAFPGVEIVTHFGTSSEAVEAVRAHKAELGVVGGLAASPELEVEPLVEDNIVLVGAPSMSGRRWEGRDLQAYTWISREEGSSTRRMMDALCQDLGISPRARLELPSWEAVKLAVAGGAGIAACSWFGVDVELLAGTLSLLDVPGWTLHRTISVVYAMDVPLTPPAEQFLDLLRRTWKPAPGGKSNDG